MNCKLSTAVRADVADDLEGVAHKAEPALTDEELQTLDLAATLLREQSVEPEDAFGIAEPESAIAERIDNAHKQLEIASDAAPAESDAKDILDRMLDDCGRATDAARALEVSRDA